jgi:hypothetical protein
MTILYIYRIKKTLLGIYYYCYDVKISLISTWDRSEFRWDDAPLSQKKAKNRENAKQCSKVPKIGLNGVLVNF